MSLIATQVQSILLKIFPSSPFNRVFSEHYIMFHGNKLFFDFYVPEIKSLFECQGQQHFKFVSHFHGDREAFMGQKKRDNLKLEYIQQEDMYLVYINYNEEVTEDLIYSRMKEAMLSELNCAGLIR